MRNPRISAAQVDVLNAKLTCMHVLLSNILKWMRNVGFEHNDPYFSRIREAEENLYGLHIVKEEGAGRSYGESVIVKKGSSCEAP